MFCQLLKDKQQILPNLLYYARFGIYPKLRNYFADRPSYKDLRRFSGKYSLNPGNFNLGKQTGLFSFRGL